jgi:hypothetical protein
MTSRPLYVEVAAKADEQSRQFDLATPDRGGYTHPA